MSSDITLDQARDFVAARIHDGGVSCPCCTQFAKVYRRRVTSTSAQALIALYRSAGLDYAHFPTVLSRAQADEAKMVHWGLIAEQRSTRADGGRAGWWRVTRHGESWLRGEITIARYVLIYDGHSLGTEGDPTTIHDALGYAFDLGELMAS